ncbi:unnamed protein product [Meganyctiphanes norvegica]|uniref:C2H2-type domain-containing protein n=1 Tax=Meganyctiphanes norvegica TaxID=48144 RepID=A0AAV2PXB6_MEGNR
MLSLPLGFAAAAANSIQYTMAAHMSDIGDNHHHLEGMVHTSSSPPNTMTHVSDVEEVHHHQEGMVDGTADDSEDHINADDAGPSVMDGECEDPGPSYMGDNAGVGGPADMEEGEDDEIIEDVEVHHSTPSPPTNTSRITPVSPSHLMPPSNFISDESTSQTMPSSNFASDDEDMEEKSMGGTGMGTDMDSTDMEDEDPASNILLKLMLSARLGKLLESLQNNNGGVGGGDEERGEPPTPPHTPQREGPPGSFPEGVPRLNLPPHALDPLQQQALHQRMLLGSGNLQSLLQLAALQEGKHLGVPLPPTLDAHKGSSTPTTPTSTGMNSGLACLSLGLNSPTLLQSGLGGGLVGIRDPLTKPNIDFTRYVTPFSSALECGNGACREQNLREHFHCIECNNKVFSKKEEMIRHFKWHKKRDESLQHGFMRYSPTDDCSDRFYNCSHNSKQTHYHCLKDGCNKVYISTSDVQMHANYHRKDSAIMQEGFQRFRGSENCGLPTCPYSGQRTTHFHCIRAPCNFTFKNKADMEKHKSYHVKDEQLSKDGFKKFMKNEECPYEGCKFSRIVNHIHCIRQDCNYVLHSSGQILAHKRKHDRQDHEHAYRKYKLAQTYLGVPEGHPALSPLLHDAMRMGSPVTGSFGPPDLRGEDSSSPLGSYSAPGTPVPPIPPPGVGIRPVTPNLLMGQFPLPPGPPGVESQQTTLARLLSLGPPHAHGMFPVSSANSITSTTASSSSGPCSPVDLSIGVGMSGSRDDRDWEKWVRWHGPENACRTGCELAGVEHWHCDDCETVFRGYETARDHGRIHEQQAIITEDHYTRILGDEEHPPCSPNCSMKNVEHYHCNWESCGEVIPESGDKPFRRLEHFRMHDFARRLPLGGPGSTSPLGMASITSIDDMFKRKRGRPPKNRIIELPVSSSHNSPQAIFTSFKLPKSSPPPLNLLGMQMGLQPGPQMVQHIRPQSMTPLGHLANMGRDGHITPPGLTIPTSNAGDRVHTNIVFLPLNGPVTINPPQPQAKVENGFHSWPEGGSCPDQLCPLSRRRHFHCAHSRCLYVTAHADVLPLHAQDFHENMPIPEGFIAIDRNIDCRAPTCQSNKVNKHFHCIRCGYSFVRYETLESHAEKHQQEDEGVHRHSLGPVSPIYLKKQPSAPDSPMEPPSSSTDSPNKGLDLSPPVIKSSGIFYPLSPFPITPRNSNINQSGVRMLNPQANQPGALVTGIPPSSRPQTTTTFTLPVSGCLTITRQSPQHFSPSPLKMEKMEEGESESSNNHSNEQAEGISQPSLTEQQAAVTAAMLVGSSWLSQEKHPQYSDENSCGRPFCKLKKKEHFHCYICNQAFSEHEKIRPHLLKHAAGGPLITSEDVEGKEENYEQNDENKGPIFVKAENSDHPFSPRSPNSTNDSSIGGSAMATSSTSPCPPTSGPQLVQQLGPQLGPHFTLAPNIPGFPSPFGPHLGFPGHLPHMLPPAAWPGVHPALAAMVQQGLIPPGIRPNGDLTHTTQSGHAASLMASNLGLFGKRLGDNDLMMSQEAKKIRSSQHSIRMLKDEPIPEGFIRYRFNEDCAYPHCGYREHQTHFHCLRKDCGYSFCDKTRFVQHTARHERLDTLMGGDFVQFRSNVSCGRPDCVYASMIGQQQNKASHFHCIKCEYVCTDTNKVVAHRRQHQKRDSINAAGFEKFTPSQPCGVQGCNHNQKQTHYHCLKCHYSVLGLSQMSAHRFRHLD